MIIIKKIYKYISCISLCLLSFYYTYKVSNYVKKNNPVYEQILEVSKSLKRDSIDSIINDEYIIPGLSGKIINIDKSFNNMNNNYNEELLVFDYIKPLNSLDNNKDKIIIRGNSNKNSVSIIFDTINDLSTYMILNNYHIDLLIDKESNNTKYELINNSNNISTYNNIERFLNKNNINHNLCLVTNNIKDICNNKYLFKPSLIINHSNISTTINQITSGEIIKIENSLTLDELKIVLQQINYQNLDILYLSELISETN